MASYTMLTVRSADGRRETWPVTTCQVGDGRGWAELAPSERPCLLVALVNREPPHELARSFGTDRDVLIVELHGDGVSGIACLAAVDSRQRGDRWMVTWSAPPE